MARFFFHVRMSNGDLTTDKEGVELVHLGRLRDSATKVAADLIRDDPSAAGWSFEVTDELGRVVLSEKLGDLATKSGSP